MKLKHCDNCGADAATVHPCAGPCKLPVPICDLCATFGAIAVPGHYVCTVCRPDVDRIVKNHFDEMKARRTKV